MKSQTPWGAWLLCLVQCLDQLDQNGLEGHAVPVVVVFCGFQDALHGVVGSNLGGLECGLATHQAANKGGCVYIAGAVAGITQAIMLVVLIVAVFHDYHAGLAGGIGNAGEDDVLGAQCGEGAQQLIDVGAIVAGLVFQAGEEGGLGDVGKQIVSFAAQGLHGVYKFCIKAGVEAAVVGHGGIDDLEAVFLGNSVEVIGHIADLLGAAQIAGVNGVKGDALLQPMVADGGHILGQIPEGVAGEATGMGGEHRGGNNAGLHAAGGDHGQGNGQGTLAQAGNVLDGKDLFVGHRDLSLFI